jgi:hypothetical protein
MKVTKLSFLYGGASLGYSLDVNIDDLIDSNDMNSLYGFFYTELLKDAISGNISDVELDLKVVFTGESKEAKDYLDVVRLYVEMHNLHKEISLPQRIGVFSYEQLRSVRNIFTQLNDEQRTILLTLVNFIGSQRLMDVCCKVFAEFLIGRTGNSLLEALGYA